MEQVVTRYNTLHETGQRPWQPVVAEGRRWSGDPATYEKVCGASFLDDDGTVPDLASDASGGKTSYDALRAGGARWAAFNAWIADPAVRAAVSDSAESVEAGGAAGGKPDIGDYSACTDRDRAGTPVG